MFEKSYLEEVYFLQLLDTEKDEAFENIVKMAKAICGTNQSFVTVLDKNRQWTKAAEGIERHDMRLQDCFCIHTIQHNQSIMIVEDPQSDSRFSQSKHVLKPNGIRFYAGVPIYTANGTAIGALCVLHNSVHHINEQQIILLKLLACQVNELLEARVERLQLEQEKKNIETNASMQTLLLSLIAHELKAPVQNALSLLDLYRLDQFSETDFTAMMSVSGAQLRHVSDAINHLLSVNETIKINGKIEKTFCMIGKEVHAIVKLNTMLFLEKRNEVKINCEVDDEVFLDPVIINTLLRNLLMNANKYSTNGIITIDILRQENGLELSVKDTGTGMEPKTIHAINNGYLPTYSTGTENGNGPGIGLLMARQYLAATGGQLIASSSINEGSKVVLHITDVQFVKAAAEEDDAINKENVELAALLH